MYYPMYFDPTYILVLIGVVICLIASAKMNSTFSRYSRVRNHSGMTGRDAAEQILHREGLYDVRIEHISGNLTDHYDPRTKTLRLSDATYNSTSVAALGVAAHECGHAVQHATGYVPLKLRSSLVPVANFGSSIAWPLIILGFFFNSSLNHCCIGFCHDIGSLCIFTNRYTRMEIQYATDYKSQTNLTNYFKSSF